MKSRRSTKKNRDEKSIVDRAMFLAEVIKDQRFWLAFSTSGRIPTYISNLGKIAIAFESMGLKNNTEIARKFINACIGISGPELIKFEKKVRTISNPIPGYETLDSNTKAKELYHAMQKMKENNYKLCDSIVNARNDFLTYLEFQNYYFDRSPDKNMNAFRKHFDAFAKRINYPDKPDLLVMLDFINSKYEGRSFPNVRFANITPTLLGYTKNVLANSSSLFLKSCGSPEALAICLRQDSYGLAVYDKNAGMKVTRIDDLPNTCLRELMMIRRILMEQALKPECFEKIFKNVGDILKFVHLLKEDVTSFSIGMSDNPGVRRNQMILDMLEAYILTNKDLLVRIAGKKEGRELMKFMPKLETAGINAVYNASAIGLLSARMKGEDYFRKLPRDLIKKIAKDAADLTEDEIRSENQPKHK